MATTYAALSDSETEMNFAGDESTGQRKRYQDEALPSHEVGVRGDSERETQYTESHARKRAHGEDQGGRRKKSRRAPPKTRGGKRKRVTRTDESTHDDAATIQDHHGAATDMEGEEDTEQGQESTECVWKGNGAEEGSEEGSNEAGGGDVEKVGNN
jgi:hypothetical protein